MINIDNEYYIDADRYNYILKRKSVSKKGNERLDEISYHSSVEGCVEHYLSLKDKHLIANTKMHFRDIVARLEDNRKNVVNEIISAIK